MFLSLHSLSRSCSLRSPPGSEVIDRSATGSKLESSSLRACPLLGSRSVLAMLITLTWCTPVRHDTRLSSVGWLVVEVQIGACRLVTSTPHTTTRNTSNTAEHWRRHTPPAINSSKTFRLHQGKGFFQRPLKGRPQVSIARSLGPTSVPQVIPPRAAPRAIITPPS